MLGKSVVYHLPQISGNSFWDVNGKHFVGSSHWKISGTNGNSEKVVPFSRLGRSKWKFVYHLQVSWVLYWFRMVTRILSSMAHPRWVLGISSDGDDRRILLGLKFLIPRFFWVQKFGLGSLIWVGGIKKNQMRERIYFLGSWLLAPFDHSCHLKSQVPPGMAQQSRNFRQMLNNTYTCTILTKRKFPTKVSGFFLYR